MPATDYECPECGSDEIEEIEEEDSYGGILCQCQDCGNEWPE